LNEDFAAMVALVYDPVTRTPSLYLGEFGEREPKGHPTSSDKLNFCSHYQRSLATNVIKWGQKERLLVLEKTPSNSAIHAWLTPFDLRYQRNAILVLG
jgi:hypothetical protein